MRGIMFIGGRRVEVREFADPVPGPGQVLVKVRSAGICGSDMRLLYRPSPEEQFDWAKNNIPGHETAGEIVALGPGSQVRQVGERVMVHWTAGCNQCPPCKEGWTIYCETRPAVTYGWGANGGDAELMLVDEQSCVPLPQALTYDDGAIIACGGATAWQALKRVAPSGLDTVVVIGMGPVGLSAMTFANALGAKTIGMDVNAGRLEMASKLGLQHALQETGAELVSAVRKLTGGRGATVALDCSGTDAGRNAALDTVGRWGRVAWVGEGNLTTIDPSPQVLHKQLTINGSWYCGVNQLHEAAQFLVDHGLHLDGMVTFRASLDQAAEAFQYFDQGGAGKAIIEFQD